MLSSVAAVSSVARASLRVRTPLAARVSRAITTYSGGQPHEGQGGFYGSIKSRSEKDAKFKVGLRAEPSDVAALNQLMEHWDAQKAALAEETEDDAVWRELVSQPDNNAMLARLVVKGAPVWGLSVPQRAFVARFMSKTA